MAARDILQSASGLGSSKLYVDDVFSTYLYDGNGATQTINNGIDLAGKGGMVWVKVRSGTGNHYLYDTTRGVNISLGSDSTASQVNNANSLTAFNATGFSIGSYLSSAGSAFTSWTFRKAPKFFDVVTYTGTGLTNRQVPHNLGTAPGMIIVKRTDTTSNWFVYHRSLSSGSWLYLNLTTGASSGGQPFGSTDPTSTYFSTDGISSNLNVSGATYVAYLFAHDATSDGIVQCGLGSGTSQVDLGWEPQFVLVKRIDDVSNWCIEDTLRGLDANTTSNPALLANTTAAESTTSGSSIAINSTGFTGVTSGWVSYIYLAIRIPNKPPTSGTEVFQPVTYTGTNTDNRLVNTGIKTDMAWFRMRSGSGTGYEGFVVGDRLRGQGWWKTGLQQAETATADGLDQQIVSTTEYGTAFSSMTGVWVGNNTGTTSASVNINANTTANNHIVEAFKRAPGFMDIVCYTGTGVVMTVPHQLGVTPELMVIKRRVGLADPIVYSAFEGPTKFLILDRTDASSVSSGVFNDTNPTTSVFTVGSGSANVNISAATYVAYLFATLPGISKVGSYTGNGTSQTIDCGFTTGARFVLIKCTTASEHWMVWDTARGILSGTSFDPPLATSSTGAENEFGIQSWIDPANQGFTIPTSNGTVNGAGRSYIYLAIA